MMLDTSPPPLPQEKGLLVTDELINHAHHGADSASVTAQLRPHSFNHLTARANTFQARFRLSAWKRNHTHARAFATRQTRLPLTFIWLCIFISCIQAGVLVDTEEFLEVKLCFFSPSIFPVHWPCKRVHGKQEALKLSTRGYPITLHLQKYSPVPFHASPFCHLAFITIYLTFLFSAEILLYIFHVNNQKPSQ